MLLLPLGVRGAGRGLSRRGLVGIGPWRLAGVVALGLGRPGRLVMRLRLGPFGPWPRMAGGGVFGPSLRLTLLRPRGLTGGSVLRPGRGLLAALALALMLIRAGAGASIRGRIG